MYLDLDKCHFSLSLSLSVYHYMTSHKLLISTILPVRHYYYYSTLGLPILSLCVLSLFFAAILYVSHSLLAV